MPTPICQGVVRGRSVILDKGAKFREGTRVVVTPLNHERGSPAAVLAALAKSPPVDPADVDELERLIEGGKRPVSRENPVLPRRRKKRS